MIGCAIHDARGMLDFIGDSYARLRGGHRTMPSVCTWYYFTAPTPM
jgi:hypothetical protein